MILLVTVGVLLVGVGFLGELVAQMRDEVEAERRRVGGAGPVVVGEVAPRTADDP